MGAPCSDPGSVWYRRSDGENRGGRSDFVRGKEGLSDGGGGEKGGRKKSKGEGLGKEI